MDAAEEVRVTIILTDVDGVLRDFVGGLCGHLNGLHKTRRSPDDFREYALSRTLDEREMLAWEAWSKGGGYLALKWHRGAREFLFWLRGRAQVVALTAAYEDQDATRAFLAPYFPPSHVRFALPEHKSSHRGDVLIEDYARTLEAWVEDNPEGLGVLINRPWNLEVEVDHPRIVRATNYRHAKHLLTTRLALKESA